MKKVHEFVTGTKVFKFEMEQDDMVAADISLMLYRTDEPDKKWTRKGDLPTQPERVDLQLKYEDGINFEGYLNRFHSVISGDNFVFMNVHYGIDEMDHFEGNIFQIKGSDANEPIS